MCHSIEILFLNSETPPWCTLVYRMKPQLPGKASQLCRTQSQAGINSHLSHYMHLSTLHSITTRLFHRPLTSPLILVLLSLACSSCLSLFINGNPTVSPTFPSHLLGNCAAPDTLLEGRKTKTKMAGPDLSECLG